jgi:SAM-dependent methyltransferase
LNVEPISVSQTRRTYDTVAATYTERMAGELAHKPFDRMWLDQLAQLTRELGPVCDLGCGPGQVARYLKDSGVDVFGADLSETMLEHARRLNRDVPFRRADMLALPFDDSSLGGIAAFYAIVHFSPAQLDVAIQEWVRVLVPGGYALVTFHIGDERRHLNEFLGHAVSADFQFFQVDDVLIRLRSAGLTVDDATIRYPYPDVEVQTQRAYVLARRPLTP